MKWINFIIFFFVASFFSTAYSQTQIIQQDFTLLDRRYQSSDIVIQDTLHQEVKSEFPSPRSVMIKSLTIPGWGQIENRQIWKVPIIYGLFAGVGIYTVYLNGEYQDHRAAYYNSFPENDDLRFGPTPEHLQGVNANQLQSNRNSFRNQRDFMFVVFGLAYGLNAVDAYVFAHMRSFDVSDDLSAHTTISPTIMAEGKPGVSLKISLFSK